MCIAKGTAFIPDIDLRVQDGKFQIEINTLGRYVETGISVEQMRTFIQEHSPINAEEVSCIIGGTSARKKAVFRSEKEPGIFLEFDLRDIERSLKDIPE